MYRTGFLFLSLALPAASLVAHTNEANGLRGSRVDPAEYEKAYDHLYNNRGYHANTTYTLEAPVVQEMVAYRAALPPTAPAFQKVVVLGCSHGKGAELLHQNGFDAWGIDVAHKAIQVANTRARTCGVGTAPCFVQGSLVHLPYADASFDAGLSVDVLEHIAPADVPQVVNEISRVTKHYLFVQIAAFKEIGQNGEKAGMRNLHLTVQGAQWWKDQFARMGWRVTQDTSRTQYPPYVKLALEK